MGTFNKEAVVYLSCSGSLYSADSYIKGPLVRISLAKALVKRVLFCFIVFYFEV